MVQSTLGAHRAVVASAVHVMVGVTYSSPCAPDVDSKRLCEAMHGDRISAVVDVCPQVR